MRSEHQRALRFIAVGVLNTAFGYGVFALLYLATGLPTLSVALATCMGILFNFFTTGRIVFQNRAWSALPSFFAAYAVSFGINIALLKLLMVAGVPALVAQAVCLPVVVVVAYLLNARFVFRTLR